MKYCRYCSFCFYGDVYYCSDKDKVLNRIDKPVNCNHFVESELGDVNTGKRYRPRRKHKKDTTRQISLFEQNIRK